MTRRSVSFQVVGKAEPKGSSKAFVPKSWADRAVAQGCAPRAVVTSDNAKSKGWQQLVTEQAQGVARDGLFVGPVVLIVTFRLPRPKSLPHRVRHHTTKPDLDKLVRSTKDALKGILYSDDSQVVDLHARKVYAAPAAAPCARITLTEAVPPDPVQADLHLDGLVSLFAELGA